MPIHIAYIAYHFTFLLSRLLIFLRFYLQKNNEIGRFGVFHLGSEPELERPPDFFYLCLLNRSLHLFSFLSLRGPFISSLTFSKPVLMVFEDIRILTRLSGFKSHLMTCDTNEKNEHFSYGKLFSSCAHTPSPPLPTTKFMEDSSTISKPRNL